MIKETTVARETRLFGSPTGRHNSAQAVQALPGSRMTTAKRLEPGAHWTFLATLGDPPVDVCNLREQSTSVALGTEPWLSHVAI